MEQQPYNISPLRDSAACRTIRLGGSDWPVPVLSARQNKVIDPIILKLLPLFTSPDGNQAAMLAKLGSEEYSLLLEIALHAITRASPQLTREAFLDLPITLPELVSAFGVIAEQTGIFARGAPGEAVGEAAGSALTGTALSPMSAI